MVRVWIALLYSVFITTVLRVWGATAFGLQCLHACTCHEWPTLGKHLSLPQWIQGLQGRVNAGHDGDEESSQVSDSKKA